MPCRYIAYYYSDEHMKNVVSVLTQSSSPNNPQSVGIHLRENMMHLCCQVCQMSIFLEFSQPISIHIIKSPEISLRTIYTISNAIDMNHLEIRPEKELL